MMGGVKANVQTIKRRYLSAGKEMNTKAYGHLSSHSGATGK